MGKKRNSVNDLPIQISIWGYPHYKIIYFHGIFHQISQFSRFSIKFPMFFLWFSIGFPNVFWIFHQISQVFLIFHQISHMFFWLSMGFPRFFSLVSTPKALSPRRPSWNIIAPSTTASDVAASSACTCRCRCKGRGSGRSRCQVARNLAVTWFLLINGGKWWLIDSE